MTVKYARQPDSAIWNNDTITDLTTYEYADEWAASIRINGCAKLSSLRGLPEKLIGGFAVEDCPSLASLEFCPSEVSGSFAVRGCPKVTSIEFLPRSLRSLTIDGCGVESYEGIHKLTEFAGAGLGSGSIVLSPATPKTHVLGLLAIRNVRRISAGTGYSAKNGSPWIEILQDALAEYPGDAPADIKRRLIFASRRLIEEVENGRELARL